MVRTTIMLPSALKRRAEEQARRQKKSLGRYIRESLQRSVQGASSGKPEADPLFGDDFVYEDGGPPDVAENHDKYLLMLAEADLARTRRGRSWRLPRGRK